MTKKWRAILLIFFSLIVILIAAGAFLRMNTKKHSPQDEVSFERDGLKLNIVYCQPYKKGRVIFGTQEEGALQPYGVYWRMGANEATTIEVNKEISFGGEKLDPGKYSIYAIPGEEKWKIGVNSDANRWGYSEPDYTKDVLNIEVPVEYSKEVIEQLTINLEPTDLGAVMVLRWDTSIVKIPVSKR